LPFAVSTAYRLPSSPPMWTTPSATAEEGAPTLPREDFQRGAPVPASSA
jgi:hypothetical protein